MNTARNVKRISNVIGQFNKAMSDYVQSFNKERFKYVIEGPKNKIGYFIQRQIEDGTIENTPLPFLNSNSTIDELEERTHRENWRYPILAPAHMTSRVMQVMFENDVFKLGLIQQRLVGTTEFEAVFESYQSALDYKLELTQYLKFGKMDKIDGWRYKFEVPKELVFYHEDGEVNVDLFSEEVVKYDTMYSINQKKFFYTIYIVPFVTFEFPTGPEIDMDTESIETYRITFNVRWEIEIPMWLILDTHFEILAYTVEMNAYIEASVSTPSQKILKIYTDDCSKEWYSYSDTSEFDIDESGIHDTFISYDQFPAYNDTDRFIVFVNDAKVENMTIDEQGIKFKRYMEDGDKIWVLRYSKGPENNVQ